MSSKMTWYRSSKHRQAFKSQILRPNRYGYTSNSDILKDITNFYKFIINIIHINRYKNLKNTKNYPNSKSLLIKTLNKNATYPHFLNLIKYIGSVQKPASYLTGNHYRHSQ